MCQGARTTEQITISPNRIFPVIAEILAACCKVDLLLAFALHAHAGLALARLAPRIYLALAYVPWYVLWKIGIYAATLRRGDTPWERTRRLAPSAAQPPAPDHP